MAAWSAKQPHRSWKDMHSMLSRRFLSLPDATNHCSLPMTALTIQPSCNIGPDSNPVYFYLQRPHT